MVILFTIIIFSHVENFNQHFVVTPLDWWTVSVLYTYVNDNCLYAII